MKRSLIRDREGLRLLAISFPLETHLSRKNEPIKRQTDAETDRAIREALNRGTERPIYKPPAIDESAIKRAKWNMKPLPAHPRRRRPGEQFDVGE